MKRRTPIHEGSRVELRTPAECYSICVELGHHRTSGRGVFNQCKRCQQFLLGGEPVFERNAVRWLFPVISPERSASDS